MTLTAAQYAAEQLVRRNQGNVSKVFDAFVYGTNKDKVLAVVSGTAPPQLSYIPARSSIAGGGSPSFALERNGVAADHTAAITTFPTLAAGDILVFTTGTLDVSITIPTAAQLAGMAADTALPQWPADATPAQTTTGAGTTTGGAAAASGGATDRHLVVYENNPTNPNYGEFLALPPGQATGVALPVFQVGTARPVAAATQGEAFYETSTRQGAVWDGAKWADITPRAQVMPWDPTKSYAPNELVTDRGMLWVTLQRAPIGDQPNAPSTVWKLLGSTGLVKITSLCDATNGIDKVPKVAGALALDSATGQIYAYDGTQWVEQFGGYYGSDTPPALEASNVRFDQLDTPTWGAIPDLQVAIKKVYDEILASGTAASAPVIGEVKMFATTTIPTGWQLCDGSAIAAGKTAAIAALGPNVPDLRDQFVRGWGTANAALTTEAANTGAPSGGNPSASSASLTVAGTTNTDGSHKHSLWARRMNAYSGQGYSSVPQTVGEGISAGGATDTSGRWMDSDGAHDHTVTGTATGTVTVDTGWDAETRPANTRLVYAIYIG